MRFLGSSSKSSLITLIILGIIIVGSLMFVGGLTPQEKKPTKNYPVEGELEVFSDSKKEQGLQLKTLKIKEVIPITKVPPPFEPKPTIPIKYCEIDTGIPVDPDSGCKCPKFIIDCQNNKCVKVISEDNVPIPEPYASNCDLSSLPKKSFYSKGWFDDLCALDRYAPDDGIYCIDKPVIYLYPETATLMNVSVETEGKIVVSDPIYPTGGWKNVLAFPNGRLIYQGEEYRELFYESEASNIKIPQEGLIVKKEDIGKALKNINKRLGLTEFESKELTDFWVPRLRNISLPYIVVSLIIDAEKDRIDKIHIKPEPDTLIEILYYFRPVDKIIDIQPLRLSQTPERLGFTAVEWGGTIEYEK